MISAVSVYILFYGSKYLSLRSQEPSQYGFFDYEISLPPPPKKSFKSEKILFLLTLIYSQLQTVFFCETKCLDLFTICVPYQLRTEMLKFRASVTTFDLKTHSLTFHPFICTPPNTHPFMPLNTNDHQQVDIINIWTNLTPHVFFWGGEGGNVNFYISGQGAKRGGQGT